MHRHHALGALAAATLALTPIANAAFLSTPLTIVASSDAGSARVTIDPFEGDASTRSSHSGALEWTLPAPLTITSDTGETIAVIERLALVVAVNQPTSRGFVLVSQSLSFEVVNVGVIPMNFVISSIENMVDIDPAEALASAGVTVTDRDGNGASITGTHAGGGAFQARYNSTELFDELLSANNPAAPYQTGVTSDTTDPFAGVGMPVTSIQTEWSFDLSGGDAASGTSVFVVRTIPTPAAATLAVLGAVAATRRRRVGSAD